MPNDGINAPESMPSEQSEINSDSPVESNGNIHGIKNYGVSDAMRNGYLDKEGIMWFGTNNEGLYRFDGTTFTHFSERDGLCSNVIKAIIEDNDGNLWFGTNEGLCRYDRKTFTHVPIPWKDTSSTWLDLVYPIVNPNEVWCLLQDKKGDFWMGTSGGGAYRYDGDTFTSFLSNHGRKQTDSLYHNVVSSVTEDAAGNIWFTSMTHGGVSRYNGTTFTHFMPEDGLSDDMVRTSFEDRAGNIWFGSLGNRNGGLDRYDPSAVGMTGSKSQPGGQGGFTNFNETDGLCNTNVLCIYEDKTGKLWLGSGRGSMCIYDPEASLRPDGKTFEPFTTKEGQTFDNISFISEDASGNIWFGGQYGQLFRYDGITLTDFTQKGR